MAIFKYEHKIIGLLIKYYRQLYYENTKDKKYLSKNFILYKSDKVLELCSTCTKKCNEKEAICTFPTLKKIENGVVVKNVCYYIDFASKLHKQYHLTNKDVSKVRTLSDKIYAALFTNDKNKLNSLLKEVEYLLQEKSNFLYFDEILSLFQAIINFQLYAIYPNKEYIDLFEFLRQHLESNDQLYCDILLNRYYTFISLDSKKRSYYFNNVIASYPSFLNYHIGDLANKLDKTDYYNYIAQIDISKLGTYDKYTVLQRRGHAAVEVKKYEEAYDYISKSINIIKSDSSRFPKLELIKSHVRKAIIAYQLGKYGDAFEDFRIVFFYEIDQLLLNFIQFMECFDKLEILEERKKYLTPENYKKINNPKIKTIFRYYQKKEIACTKKDYQELAKYICNDLKPYIRNGTFYDTILLEHLKLYCDKTSSYKYIRDFVFYDQEHGFENK